MNEAERLSRLAAINFGPDINRLTEGFFGREWLFDEIDDWLERQDERLFILTGEPGVGKSAIAARLTQVREDIAAYHFCIAGRNSTVVPGTALRSLAAQLGDHLPGYGQALANTIKPIHLRVEVDIDVETMTGGQITGVVINHLHAGDPEEELDILLRAPLAELPAPPAPVLILVDSLDEAVTYRGEVNLVTLLAEVDDLPSWVRFLCTSRPEQRVLRYFDGLAPYVLAAESKMNLEDVGRYIAYRVAKDGMPARLQEADVGPEHLADRVDRLADGNFLYAKMLLNDVEAGRQPLDDLEALPQSLDGIYHGFLTRFAVGEWEERYQPLLAVLAVAQEPINEDQIAGFTGLRRTKVRQYLGVVQQFLDERRDGEGQETYTLFHQSLRDYLLDKSRSKGFWCAPEDGHSQIANHYLESYGDQWLECDLYGLRHATGHLAAALMRRELSRLLGNVEFLEAKTDRLGIYALLDDLRTSLSALPTASEPYQDIRGLLRLLDLEAHNLQDWGAGVHPAFFAQQVYNQAIEQGLADLAQAARERLTQIGEPYLAVRFRVSPESPAFLRTLSGRGMPLLRLAVSPDGRLALAGSDEALKVWNIETGEQVRAFRGKWQALGFTAGGEQAVLFKDGSLVLWDLSKGSTIRTLEGGGEWAQGLEATPDGSQALCATADHQLRLVDLESGDTVLAFDGPGYPIEHLVLTPDGRYAISATQVEQPAANEGDDSSYTYPLQRWDLETGQELPGFGDLPVRDLAVTPDGRLLIASVARRIAIWDLNTGQKSMLVAGGYSGALAVSPDSRILVYANTGGEPFELRMLDLRSNQELDTLMAHPYPANELAISPDGRHLVSICSTGEMKVWDWQSLQSGLSDPDRVPTGTRVWVRGITPNGRLGILTAEDKALVVQELATGRQFCPPLEGHQGIVRGVLFTSDSRFAISGSEDGTLRMWDLYNGDQVLELPYYGLSYTRAFALFPDDRYLIAASKPGELRVWDLQTGQAVGEPFSVGDEVQVILITSDGQRAIVASGTTITIWNMETRRLLYTLESQHQDSLGVVQTSIHELVISSDERYLFSIASYDNTIEVYDLQRGEVLSPLVDHSEWVRAVAVTADGQYAISAANDGLIIVWDWRVPREVRRLVGHADWVYDMELTQDNRRVFSISQDRTVRVWDWKTGKTLASTSLASILDRLGVTPDGQRLLVGDRTGCVCCLDYVEPTKQDA